MIDTCIAHKIPEIRVKYGGPLHNKSLKYPILEARVKKQKLTRGNKDDNADTYRSRRWNR